MTLFRLKKAVLLLIFLFIGARQEIVPLAFTFGGKKKDTVSGKVMNLQFKFKLSK